MDTDGNAWNGSLVDEQGLGNHPVDAFGAVYELGDFEIDGDAGEHVGFGLFHLLFGDEEIDRFTDGDFGGFGEVFVDAHDDPVGGGFGAGPGELHVFTDEESERAGEGGFEGGDIDFAIALGCVAVADFEEGAGGVNGDEEGGSGDEAFVVEIAGVGAGRGAADPAGGFVGGNAHAAEERLKRDVDAIGEVGGHAVFVEGDDLGFLEGEVFGEEAEARGEAVVGVGEHEIDFEDADFEDVAGLGGFDEDGAGEDVAAGAFVFDLGVDVAEGLLDLLGGDSGAAQAGGAVGEEGLDFDRVAGGDAEDGLGLGVVVAPGDGGGGCEQLVGGSGRGGLSLLGGGRRCDGGGKKRCE